MEETAAAAQHDVVLGAETVGKSGAGIKFASRTVNRLRWQRFKLVTHSVIQRQMIGRAPVVLQIKTTVRMAYVTLCLIADSAGYAPPLEHRRTESGFRERRGLEALEENHFGEPACKLEGHWVAKRQSKSASKG